MSRLRLHFPALYRFAALLALAAILTPVLTMLVHHPRPETEMAQAAMPNCGMDMGKDSAPHKNKDTPQKTPVCPICMGLHLMAGGFVPPDAVLFSAPDLPVASYAMAWRAFCVAFPVAPQARPRAPPALV